jgi:hypothetical protein
MQAITVVALRRNRTAAAAISMQICLSHLLLTLASAIFRVININV